MVSYKFTPSSHFGFTLVEFLATVSILGILVALLFPAINSIRRASRDAQCKNNLRQIAVGLINFESATSQFPPGQLVTQFDFEMPESDAESRFVGHIGFILPFVEQNSLKQVIDMARGPWFENQQVTEIVSASDLGVLKCPEDSLGDRETHLVSIQGRMISGINLENPSPGWSNYLGAAGTFFDVENSLVSELSNTGVLYADSRIRLADISDGASNTILIGEVLGGVFPLFNPDPPIPGTVVNSRHSILQNGIPGSFLFSAMESGASAASFSGLHAGGRQLNVVLCDGSVRPVFKEADKQVLISLVTRANQENVPR